MLNVKTINICTKIGTYSLYPDPGTDFRNFFGIFFRFLRMLINYIVGYSQCKNFTILAPSAVGLQNFSNFFPDKCVFMGPEL